MKNGQKRTERHHPTNSQVHRIIKDIRSLRDSGKSDFDIRLILKIEERTFRRYSSKIHEEDQEVWLSITRNEFESQLIKLKQSLEETYKISRDMALDPKCEDRLTALQSKDDARLSIIHLLSEYPNFIRTTKIEQPTKPYVEKYEWKDNAEEVLENK